MTTPEDRLRQILLAEADDVVPVGDGLQRIQQRLSDRRSLRSKLIPAIAIAGVAAIAGAAAVTVSLTDKDSLKQVPGHHPASPVPTTCTGGLCEEPKPSPSLSTTGVTTSASGIPVWPFSTDAQAADWERHPGAQGWADDPVQVAQHLLADYLKLPGRAVPRTDDDQDSAVVAVSAAGRTVARVRLVRVGRDQNGPWSVVGADAPSLSVTQPRDGDEVSSPINIAGTAADPDTSVHVRLLATRALGDGHTMAGRDIPWTHSLPWTGSDWSVAALVANTFDGKGDLHSVTITAVRRAGSSAPDVPAPGSVFVAIDQEHVVTVDALTGKQLRQLSYPPAGVVDTSPDRGGSDGVVWVRIQPDACTSSIIRVGLSHGPAGVTVDAKPIGRKLPSLSEGGRSLGWVEQPCGGSGNTLIVRGPDAKFSTTATSDVQIRDLDVRDDGYAVVWSENGVLIVPPGATTVSAGHLLRADGCSFHAPAWDGDQLIAWRLCGASWTLTRWTAIGTLVSASADVPDMSAPLHTSVDDGLVLVSLDSYRIPRFTDGALVDTPNALRWKQADW
ncbi:MAG: hypothetical protein QOJ79_947 [Actinomycetota bacterium]|nr:hypothetical protein [Actinomycetota bacterium]